MKEEFFSKFKDYNGELEKILEKKDFSKDSKSLLLSMFYKLESSYSDYETVKRKVKSKQEFLENILENYDDNEIDSFLLEAIDVVIQTGQASTSFIQRRFKVGYARAGRIIDQMEERGIISGYQGSKPREVLMTKERWMQLKNNDIKNKEVDNSAVEENKEEINEDIEEKTEEQTEIKDKKKNMFYKK